MFRHQQVLNACSVDRFPNVRAVATKLVAADPDLNVDHLEEQAKTCVQPGPLWFTRKFNVKLRPMLDVFKYVRFFCPAQVLELRPNEAAIEELRRLPFLDDEAAIAGLQAKLPAYMAESSQFTSHKKQI